MMLSIYHCQSKISYEKGKIISFQCLNSRLATTKNIKQRLSKIALFMPKNKQTSTKTMLFGCMEELSRRRKYLGAIHSDYVPLKDHQYFPQKLSKKLIVILVFLAFALSITKLIIKLLIKKNKDIKQKAIQDALINKVTKR